MSSRIAPYAIRPARREDVAVVARHRVGMFRDMGILPDGDESALERGSRLFLERAIPAGEYRGWLVERDGAVVAGGGGVLRPLLPRPGYNDGGTEVYVLNVYTDPAHRRRGLARALMDAILDWCRAQGIAKVTLHASDEGRPLYESLGFTTTNEMEWTVRR